MNLLAGKFASGIARLASLGKQQTDDPLTNLKAASRWLGNLPVGDAYKCQEAILNELKRFNENSTQYTKDRLAVLMLLDEKSRDLQDILVRQYLRNPRMSRAVESQLWHAVYGLYWEIARGYHAFVLHFTRGAGKSTHESQIPLITLRAIRMFGQLLKWRAIRYLPAGEKLWMRLHNLYRVAENESFHRRPQRVYMEDATECSCEGAYLHILMLNLANSGTLYTKQVDLLDHWLYDWHAQLHLDTRADADEHSFAIDLSADHGPRRVRKTDTEKPMRFWGTSSLLQKLGELHTALREGGTPAQLGLTENARTSESLELLEYLQRSWSSLESREQRRAPRESVKRLVDVTHGLSSIISQIKSADAPATAVSPYGSRMNYDETEDVQLYGFVTDRTRKRVSQLHMPVPMLSPDVERWVMQDESACGYGAIIESRNKDWLRVGALIGVKPHDDIAWQIGFIRRLSRLNDDTSSVGIETVLEAPVLAMLYDTTSSGYTVDGYDNSSNGLPHASLWMGCSKTDSLIIDPVLFMPGRVFQIHGVPGRKLIALGNPIERSEGWMRVLVEPMNG